MLTNQSTSSSVESIIAKRCPADKFGLSLQTDSDWLPCVGYLTAFICKFSLIWVFTVSLVTPTKLFAVILQEQKDSTKSLGYSRSFLLKGDWLVFGVGLKWTLKELHCWFNSLVAWFTVSLCSILCSKFSTDLLLKCVSCHLPTGLLRDCCPCG